jgi:hypothetical protein
MSISNILGSSPSGRLAPLDPSLIASRPNGSSPTQVVRNAAGSLRSNPVPSPSNLSDTQTPDLVTVLSPGSNMRDGGVLTRLGQKPNKATADAIELALTDEWLSEFNKLGDPKDPNHPRKQVARSLLVVVLNATQKSSYEDGWLNPEQLPEALAEVLKVARNWTVVPPRTPRTPAQPGGRPPQDTRPLPDATRPGELPDAIRPGQLPEAARPSTPPTATQPQPTTPNLPAPVLVERWQKATGQVSVALGANVNPYLRSFLADNKSVEPYDVSETDADVNRVQAALIKAGVSEENAPQATRNLMAMAKALNVNAVTLAGGLADRLEDARALVASVTSSTPLVIDPRDPVTMERAKQYYTALYSLGEYVPPQTSTVDKFNPKTGRMEPHDITTPARIVLTPTMTDLDGVIAKSYGSFGMGFVGINKKGERFDVYVALGKSLGGTPTALRGVQLTADSRSLLVNVDVRDPNTNSIVNQTMKVPLNKEQAEAILNSVNLSSPTSHEGLTARVFPPDAMALLQTVSTNNGKAALFNNAVVPNGFVGNTFGTRGPASGEGAGTLGASLGRSVEESGVTYKFPSGGPAPYFEVYSGGAARSYGPGEKNTAVLFGLDARDAEGITNVAKAIPKIVDELGKKYGLTAEQMAAWHQVNFTEPDIPSIILPSAVVSALAQRGNTRPGLGLADLQAEIEEKVLGLIAQQGIGDKYKIHHTQSGSNDTLALAKFRPDGTIDGKITTEWQINVKGGKALPVLDGLATQLKDLYGIDLLGALKAEGYDWNYMRKLELHQVLAFFKTKVRPIMDKLEKQAGVPLASRIIIQVDTYGATQDAAKNWTRGGSDYSLVAAAEALYKSVIVTQVDTLAGAKSTERAPEFVVERNSEGRATLIKPSVPASMQGSPSIYVNDQATLSKLLLDAYNAQTPVVPPEKKTRQ